MTTREVLLEAARRFRTGRYTWCQGRYYGHDSDFECCIVGGVMRVEEGQGYYHGPAEKVLKDFLHQTPEVWNDTDGRTLEEVIAALEGAAALEEAVS